MSRIPEKDGTPKEEKKEKELFEPTPQTAAPEEQADVAEPMQDGTPPSAEEEQPGDPVEVPDPPEDPIPPEPEITEPEPSATVAPTPAEDL